MLKSDLLWSDPTPNEHGDLDADFEVNPARGCSYFFGRTATNELLSNNQLISIIRGHEVQFEGFKFFDWTNQGFPQVINVFSAANYCQKYNNKGAIIVLDVA